MRIIVADDDQVSLALLEHTLTKWGYDVECASDGVSALQALNRDDAPRIAVLDWMMPGMNGIDICKAIRTNQTVEKGYTYIILLTIRSSLFDMVDGLSAGADDYIIKPFIPQDLKVRLDAGKRIVELQEKLVDARRILDLQHRDLTTRAWDRETILYHLNAEMNRAKRKGRSLSIALLKICNYHEITDSLGKTLHDEFLRNAMMKLSEAIRSYDYIGRYDEDEFLILFPETIKEEMPAITDRLLNVADQTSFSGNGFTKTITAVIGVVTCMGCTAEDVLMATVSDILKQARSERSRKALFSFV